MRLEQTQKLALFEQIHGQVIRVPDDHPMAEGILAKCVTDTRVYLCKSCKIVVTIEPDGETQDVGFAYG